MLPTNLSSALYDAANLASKIENALLETGGELTPEIEDLINFKDYQKSDFEASIDIVAMTHERMQSIISYYETNIEMLNRILSSIVKASDKLISNVGEQMASHNLESISGIQREFKFRSNPPSVEILDESQIPEECKELKMTESISKKKIKELLSLGQDVPGARMIQKKSLKIVMAKMKVGSHE